MLNYKKKKKHDGDYVVTQFEKYWYFFSSNKY